MSQLTALRFEKNSDQKASEHFDAAEFDCQCKREDCKTTWIEPRLLEKLERIRGILGKPIYILSGYRCKMHQEKLIEQGLSDAKVSQHCLGSAVDIRFNGPVDELIDAAETVGIMAIGIANRWIHIDLREGRIRRWRY